MYILHMYFSFLSVNCAFPSLYRIQLFLNSHSLFTPSSPHFTSHITLLTDRGGIIRNHKYPTLLTIPSSSNRRSPGRNSLAVTPQKTQPCFTVPVLTSLAPYTPMSHMALCNSQHFHMSSSNAKRLFAIASLICLCITQP